MNKDDVPRWLVQFAATDALTNRPGDLLNLIYEMRRWLDIERDEPFDERVRELEQDPARLQSLIRKVSELVNKVADGERFETQYSGARVILDAAKLRARDRRALSYREEKLDDAVLLVAIEDIHKNVEAALRIRRCPELGCGQVFYAKRENQKYCSHSCASKNASREYQEREKKKIEQESATRTRSSSATDITDSRRTRSGRTQFSAQHRIGRRQHESRNTTAGPNRKR